MKECSVCKSSYKPRQFNQRFCSTKCRRINDKKVRNRSSLRELNSGKIGAVSELEMSAYYLRQGYEVFRNVSSNGIADLIIWKPETGEIHHIDVKSLVNVMTEESLNNYVERLEQSVENKVSIVPYDYNNKEPRRML